jgi:hypothetical protein
MPPRLEEANKRFGHEHLRRVGLHGLFGEGARATRVRGLVERELARQETSFIATQGPGICSGKRLGAGRIVDRAD